VGWIPEESLRGREEQLAEERRKERQEEGKHAFLTVAHEYPNKLTYYTALQNVDTIARKKSCV
jgi:hypothetical protein